ncbi:hypothetical protein E2C01_024829 [Portunus trituberculatus]|uniref:Uncharacterized protein n=1 Tax=Portunus trituberculatus TaxID=210409 RepID=A0A5B7EEF1_PORTR|nr:hypothetical protein [Portunus trituberculatus]
MPTGIQNRGNNCQLLDLPHQHMGGRVQVVVEVVGGGLGCSRLGDVSSRSGGGLQGAAIGCLQGCLLTLCLLQGLLKVLCGVGSRATHACLN